MAMTMPQFFFPPDERDHERPAEQRSPDRRNIWSRLSLQKIGHWLKREDEEPPPGVWDEKAGRVSEDNKENGRPGLLGRRTSRRVVPGLPRPLTFKRMNSERRDRLLPVEPGKEERRAASVDRRGSAQRTLTPPPVSIPSRSAPEIQSPFREAPGRPIGGGQDSNIPPGSRQIDFGFDQNSDPLPPGGPPPPLSTTGQFTEHDIESEGIDENLLQQELEAKWILNLSMHFRDLSDREKFFITYAEESNKWRRVTVSCDYRDVQPDSLEADLKSLHYQRDKSARIYESIRDSLPDIQFYDTVTNLRLQTADGRLHVHVTEDVNEIIPYPATPAVDHLSCPKFRESAINFESHISGFVYKVTVHGKLYIKKEIPGPDAVEEFLYEINALCNLRDSKSVIRFEGVIVDDKDELIKGLLISYADQGALVDLLYDWKNTEKLPWERRERWAKQIVEGLSEIHEAGFVQGDFTLSNIVINERDDAKIIDINRRGCPVGWEPPELAKLIESGQRISIYIGVKSDLFQLGMVLWALAEQQDEPERQERPLIRTFARPNNVPQYYRELVTACLSENPRGRLTARDLLRKFPNVIPEPPKPLINSRHSMSTHRSDKEYIDPATAVGLEDISTHRQRSTRSRSSFSAGGITSADGAPSTEYRFGSSGSYIIPHPRGRAPAIRSNSRRRQYDNSPYAAPRSVMSLDDSELENEPASLPESREPRWEQVYVDGNTRLVQRHSLGIPGHDFVRQEPADVCISTPPGELDNSLASSFKSGDTPLQLSATVAAATAELQRPATPPSIGRARNATFSDRVHQLDPQQDCTLVELEDEIGKDSVFGETSRTGTGFSIRTPFTPPVHQDSGFSEPTVDLDCFVDEAARIRASLEVRRVGERDGCVEGTLWEEAEQGIADSKINEGTRPQEMGIRTKKSQEKEKEAEKAVEEKTAMRPPSIVIPEFHHDIPKAVDDDGNIETGKI